MMIVNVATAGRRVFGLPTRVSWTSIVNVEVALFAVGVPVMAPVVLLNRRPLGSLDPTANFQEYGGSPPAAPSKTE